MVQARRKIGIDANRPIDPQSGAIAPQVADPAVVADTGAGWARLNFVLGPWSAPGDTKKHDGRTWADTYRKIVEGLRGRDLNIYGLISSEAVSNGPGDSLRNPPDGAPDHEWIARYAENFKAIVALFHDEIGIFESFNEPDDWHGASRNWLHPGWFAILLQRVWDAVKSDPALAHVRLVSGPLQGLAINNNAAAIYLQACYQEGKRRFHWGQNGRPFPFDGVGYHLYVAEGFRSDLSPEARRQEVRDAYHRYVDGFRAVIRVEEGRDKPIYISEMGWHSNHNPEEFQAEAMRQAFELVLADPGVELGIWFCTQDFGPAAGDKFYGLYRPGPLNAENRKPAYQVFQEICGRSLAGPQPDGFDNRTLIRAVTLAAGELGADRYKLLDRADLWSIFFDRARRYQGPAVSALPGLSEAERALIEKKLNALRSGAGRRRGEVATDMLNLRSGPGTEHAVLDQLPNQTSLLVLDEQGDWLRVEARGQDGFVHRRYVTLLDEAPPAGFLRSRADLAELALEPPPDKLIHDATATNDDERRLVSVWNRYGRLLAALADELRIDPTLALAVLLVESGGQPFASDGRMIIRFENHRFFNYWGTLHPTKFDQHFDFNREVTWKDHRWRQTPNGEWQPQHLWNGSLDANQRGEWEVFDFASTLDRHAALLSISMGAPQIMGFNYDVIGYESPEQMFEAFADERAQFLGLFDFVKAHHNMVRALQRRDYLAFAREYNGPGQPDIHAGRMSQFIAAFDQLLARQPAVSLTVMPSTPRIAPTGVSFLPLPWWPLEDAENARPDDGTKGETETGAASAPLEIDEALRDAWHEHVRSGLQNNNVMFHRILSSIMVPYYLTIVLYGLLFVVGIGLFVVAAMLASNPETVVAGAVFGGLSVAAFLAFFIRQPLRALEENLQFITWLGVVYNTYWTRLLYMQDRATVQADIKDATQDVIQEIERLVDKSSKLAAKRGASREED